MMLIATWGKMDIWEDLRMNEDGRKEKGGG